VLALKPVRLAVTVTALVPDPIDCEVVAVDVTNVLLVPHSKYAVVDEPLGFAVPLSVADVAVTLVAVLDETVGTTPPPVVVPRMVPLLPTTVPVLAPTNDTALSVFVVPLDWLVQLVPPFAVRRIIPLLPTTTPLFASAKETPYNVFVVPLD
jgi:hypothetical protein